MNVQLQKSASFVKNNPLTIAGGLIIAWFIIAFLIVPNTLVVFRSFVTEEGFTFGLFTRLLDSKNAVDGVKNSFILAFALVITSNILGTFMVMAVEYFEVKGSNILRVGYLTTFIYSGIILVSGYIMVYGRNGLITKGLISIFPNLDPNYFEGFWAVLFVMTVGTTTLHMLFLTNAIKSIDNFTIEAARNLGGSTMYIIRKIVLPIIAPTLFAITILQFLTGLGALSAPLMVGGKDFRTISPLILQLNSIPTAKGLAIVLSMILGITTLVLLVIFARIEEDGTYFSISKTKATFVKQKINNPIANVIIHILAYLVFIVYVTPVLLIVLFSFTNANAIYNLEFSPSSFTLENYRTILTNPDTLAPFINSIIFSIEAAVAVVVIVMLGTALRHNKKNFFTAFIEYSFLIPWMLPGTLIAIALLTTFSTPNILVARNVLIGTTLILVLGYIIIRMPFTSRLLRAAFQSLDDDYIKAAKSLGAKPLYAFRRITLPLIMPTAVALIALSFNDLLRDYNMAAFLSHPTRQPLGMLIYTYTFRESSGDTQAFIYVFSTILMVISGITMVIVYRVILNEHGFKWLRNR